MEPEIGYGQDEVVHTGVGLEPTKPVRERGVSSALAARELEIRENVLRKWLREADAEPVWAAPKFWCHGRVSEVHFPGGKRT